MRPSVLEAGGERYTYANLRDVLPELNGIPRSLRILFENVARRSPEALPAIRAWAREPAGFHEIPFYPARILMHDTTCGPALADLAALRDAVAAAGGDPRRANPVIPVDLVIDHSVAVDHHARKNAIELNLAADFRRNAERYAFVKWAMQALSNFRVVPPGNGILHQLNLEFLARVVQVSVQADGSKLAFPDTLLGTDSHTPMVNALGVLGWGVGGIEGQAAMLGQAVAVRIPPVVGVELQGTLPSGVGATDLVLAATQALRAHGVVGKFVEFFGAGVRSLSLADRATLSNMAPEYGATCAFFPIDEATLAYLHLTGRNEAHIELIERYARAQGLWQDNDALQFSEVTRIDLAAIEPTVAGPSQPHERRSLSGVPASFAVQSNKEDGAVVLAAITSCTNTSNPALLVGAGLLARKARALGLAPKPWVKTSFSPGSAAVSAYLGESGLLEDLEALGFGVVGYGCMTCIGNSGELDAQVIRAVEHEGLRAVGVLSGNRNFQGRVNPHLAGAYLCSPALVIAYALAGTVLRDLTREPLGLGSDGRPVFLRDIAPASEEVSSVLERWVRPALFAGRYDAVWEGSAEWRAVPAPGGVRFPWDPKSDYVRPPPYFEGATITPPASLAIRNARVLLKLGDNVTTDHISPAGAIPRDSLAGKYLRERGVVPRDFNQYSTRRTNHEVMLRGAFSNPGLINELGPVDVYSRKDGGPFVIVAGNNYGAGSSRDWAAKAPALLGVKAIAAASFERLHRSNLIGMGIVPLTLPAGVDRHRLARDGTETIDFEGLDSLQVGNNTVCAMVRRDAELLAVDLDCRIDSGQELAYLRNGGLLPYVWRRIVTPLDA